LVLGEVVETIYVVEEDEDEEEIVKVGPRIPGFQDSRLGHNEQALY